MELIVFIALHKGYHINEKAPYQPIHVGCNGKEKIFLLSDDTGDNISHKNSSYCELTALYWIWKNYPGVDVGLVHYRRYFGKKTLNPNQWRKILDSADYKKLLSNHDVIVPKPRHYLIETTWSQYAHAHHEIDLVMARDCIIRLYPEYITAFDYVMKRRTAHRFNMFVMKRSFFDRYCTWLFDILFALEGCLDIESYSIGDKRVFGYISERLLDVWLYFNNVRYAEQHVVFLEKQHWPKKITLFLLRKVRGELRPCLTKETKSNEK